MKPATNLIAHAPAARCYRCGSTQIYSVCHHCGKPMCPDHSPAAFRRRLRLVEQPEAPLKPASREFAWLRQDSPREAAVYHCEEHAHRVGWLELLADRLAWRRGPRDDALRLPLPVVPYISSVDVVERLSGEIRFDDGRYVPRPGEDVKGEITVEMSANDGPARLSRYRKKHRLTDDDPVAFAAGFAMIKGKAGLRFTDEPDLVLADGTGLSLSGDSADGHHLFTHLDGRPMGEWKLTVGYDLERARVPKRMPLWIVPSLLPSSDRRVLEIDLHWIQLNADGRKLNLVQFELIELVVPAAWGEIRESEPTWPTIRTAPDSRERIIRWERIEPKENGSRPGRWASVRGDSRTLSLRFENPILPGSGEERGDADETFRSAEPVIRGTLRAKFDGTLSGVEDIRFFLPGGGLAFEDGRVRSDHGAETGVRTEATVHFEISLSAIRYQRDWSVPWKDNATAAGDAQRYLPTDEFTGVAPDYRVVTELTNLISSEGYYVNSVIEDLPKEDHGRGSVVKRKWDIEGRWYEGVFPVSFRINLLGEDAGEGGNGSTAKTTATVSVRGTYVDDPGLGQRGMIEDTWVRLHGHVTELLSARAAAASGVPVIGVLGSPGGNGRWPESAHTVTAQHNGVQDNRFTHGAKVIPGEVVTSRPTALESDNDPAAIRSELWQDLHAARRKLMRGEWTEERYDIVVGPILRALRQLGENI